MASRDTDYARLAALSQICELFAKACDEKGVSPLDAYQALGRLLEFGASSTAISSKAFDVQKVKLSEEQKAEAKRLAKEAKAKRLKVQLSEINLTSAEIKQALEEYSKGLSNTTMSYSTSPDLSIGKPPSPNKEKPVQSSKPGLKSVKETKPAEPQKGSLVSTIERTSAKARIDNLRRNTVKWSPWTKDSPLVLHILGYQNFRKKLAARCEEFKASFDVKDTLHPLRCLPDLEKNEEVHGFIQGLLASKAVTSDTDHFLLQDSNGDLWYDQDMPSKTCPDDIRKGVPDEILKKIIDLSTFAKCEERQAF